jgi:L-aspartate oxidase
VHGANRLASNSLLEGMVFAPRAVEAIESGVSGPEISGAMRSVFVDDLHPPRAVSLTRSGTADGIGGRVLTLPDQRTGRPDHQGAIAARQVLQRTMTLNAGVVRTAESLGRAARDVRQVHAGLVGEDPAESEVRNLSVVALALTVAAAARQESRGAHTRTDFALTDPAQRYRLVLLAADRTQPISSNN